MWITMEIKGENRKEQRPYETPITKHQGQYYEWRHRQVN